MNLLNKCNADKEQDMSCPSLKFCLLRQTFCLPSDGSVLTYRLLHASIQTTGHSTHAHSKKTKSFFFVVFD